MVWCRFTAIIVANAIWMGRRPANGLTLP